ncbi:hypothetical protein UF75_4560 [Desulfosporosinus sp. I2]|nr:hypothetical protein UF75_4560 [Desulfosporosinus sp. I2]
MISVSFDLHLFMAFRTAGIRGLRESFSVATFPILTDKHLALFALDLQKVLSTLWALISRQIIMLKALSTAHDRRYQLRGVSPDSLQKHLAISSAFANLGQLLFPLGGEFW